ncbi:hypothetical protein COK00_12160 [Bacillus cereus]|uniref:hypothetical protein n=1 Tax=Bacillus cereus TaxID=1396 RepID=UPI000BF6587E|nr:hypothetical protein [Bacillus cereus]PFB64469.1 hypothetical protein CN291_17475 [Bacillus cereus]PFP65343.1 hypothetical protein COK00_12160 [Bacillus cereus]PGT10099.1 hypothetical protein COD03_20200 [Bacillus cereus]
MKELKVMVSPHFSEEVFEDKVSGLVFEKGRSVIVHSIDIEENKLSGIQAALRKNILLPYDKQTLEFVNGKNFAKDEAPVEPVVVEPVVEAKAEVEEKPAKKTRKSTKKETE